MEFRLLVLIVLGVYCHGVLCGELTFELPDNEKMCFHELIEKGTKSTLEFQVVMGGNYDVDMELTAPNGQILYKDVKKQYDSFTWNADFKGIYTFCFSNEFSTFTHKVVYFDLQVGEEKPIVENLGEHATAMTLMEATSTNIHGHLAKVSTMQSHLRLREAMGRAFAEQVNAWVLYWSLGETIAVLVVGLGQVIVLRSFFSASKSTTKANITVS